MRIRLALLLGACVTFSVSARASDGVLEINQACAATGCFAGDAAGFPVTIGAPGSYRLTSNLAVSAANVSAITINGARIRIDLGGFEVGGPGSCTGNGAALVCTGGGTATGITAFAPGTRVENGSVRGFGGGGAALGGGQGIALRVEENGVFGMSGSAFDVVADRNAGIGIVVTEGIVKNCIATRNAGTGISGFTSRIVDSVVSANGERGISVQQASVVSDNVVRTSGTQGIFATGGVIRNNAVELNDADGIVGHTALIVGNTSTSNAQAGIAALAASSVIDNMVRFNTGVGIYLFPELGGAAAAYRGNVVIAGPATTTVVNGVNMGSNSCNGATTCP